MVLGELGSKINTALRTMTKAQVVDSQVRRHGPFFSWLQGAQVSALSFAHTVRAAQA